MAKWEKFIEKAEHVQDYLMDASNVFIQKSKEYGEEHETQGFKVKAARLLSTDRDLLSDQLTNTISAYQEDPEPTTTTVVNPNTGESFTGTHYGHLDAAFIEYANTVFVIVERMLKNFFLASGPTGELVEAKAFFNPTIPTGFKTELIGLKNESQKYIEKVFGEGPSQDLGSFIRGNVDARVGNPVTIMPDYEIEESTDLSSTSKHYIGLANPAYTSEESVNLNMDGTSFSLSTREVKKIIIPIRLSPEEDPNLPSDNLGWDDFNYSFINSDSEIVQHSAAKKKKQNISNIDGIEVDFGAGVTITEIVYGKTGIWVGIIFESSDQVNADLDDLTDDNKRVLYTRLEYLRKKISSIVTQPDPLLAPKLSQNDPKLRKKAVNIKGGQLIKPGSNLNWSTLEPLDVRLAYFNFNEYNRKEAKKQEDELTITAGTIENNSTLRYSEGYYYFIVGDGWRANVKKLSQQSANKDGGDWADRYGDPFHRVIFEEEDKKVEAVNVTAWARREAFENLLKYLGKDTTFTPLLGELRDKYFTPVESQLRTRTPSPKNQRILFAIPASYIDALPPSKTPYSNNFDSESEFSGGRNFVFSVRLNEIEDRCEQLATVFDKMKGRITNFRASGGVINNPYDLEYDIEEQIKAIEDFPTQLKNILYRQSYPYSSNIDDISDMMASGLGGSAEHIVQIGIKDNGLIGEDVRETISHLLFSPDPEILKNSASDGSEQLFDFDPYITPDEISGKSKVSRSAVVMRIGLDYIRQKFVGVLGSRTLHYIMFADNIIKFESKAKDLENNDWVKFLQAYSVPPLKIYMSKDRAAKPDEITCKELIKQLNNSSPEMTKERRKLQELVFNNPDCVKAWHEEWEAATPAMDPEATREALLEKQTDIEDAAQSASSGESWHYRNFANFYNSFLFKLDVRDLINMLMACAQHKLGVEMTGQALCDAGIIWLIEEDPAAFKSFIIENTSPEFSSMLGLGTQAYLGEESAAIVKKVLNEGEQPTDLKLSPKYRNAPIATAMALSGADSVATNTILNLENGGTYIELVPGLREQKATTEQEIASYISSGTATRWTWHEIEAEKTRLKASGYSTQEINAILVSEGYLVPKTTQYAPLLDGAAFMEPLEEVGIFGPGTARSAKEWLDWVKGFADITQICNVIVGPLLEIPHLLFASPDNWEEGWENWGGDYADRFIKLFSLPKMSFNFPSSLRTDDLIGDYGQKLLDTFLATLGALLGEILSLVLKQAIEECFEEDPAPSGDVTEEALTIESFPFVANIIKTSQIGGSRVTREQVFNYISDLIDSIRSRGQLCALFRGQASKNVLDGLLDRTKENWPEVFNAGVDTTSEIKIMFATIGRRINLEPICNFSTYSETVVPDICDIDFNHEARKEQLKEEGLTDQEAKLQVAKELEDLRDRILALSDLIPGFKGGPLQGNLLDMCSPESGFRLPATVLDSMERITDNILTHVKGSLLSDLRALKYFATPPRSVLAASDPDELAAAHEIFIKPATIPFVKKFMIYIGPTSDESRIDPTTPSQMRYKKEGPGLPASWAYDNQYTKLETKLEYRGERNYMLAYNEKFHYKAFTLVMPTHAVTAKMPFDEDGILDKGYKAEFGFNAEEFNEDLEEANQAARRALQAGNIDDISEFHQIQNLLEKFQYAPDGNTGILAIDNEGFVYPTEAVNGEYIDNNLLSLYDRDYTASQHPSYKGSWSNYIDELKERGEYAGSAYEQTALAEQLLRDMWDQGWLNPYEVVDPSPEQALRFPTLLVPSDPLGKKSTYVNVFHRQFELPDQYELRTSPFQFPFVPRRIYGAGANVWAHPQSAGGDYYRVYNPRFLAAERFFKPITIGCILHPYEVRYMDSVDPEYSYCYPAAGIRLDGTTGHDITRPFTNLHPHAGAGWYFNEMAKNREPLRSEEILKYIDPQVTNFIRRFRQAGGGRNEQFNNFLIQNDFGYQEATWGIVGGAAAGIEGFASINTVFQYGTEFDYAKQIQQGQPLSELGARSVSIRPFNMLALTLPYAYGAFAAQAGPIDGKSSGSDISQTHGNYHMARLLFEESLWWAYFEQDMKPMFIERLFYRTDMLFKGLGRQWPQEMEWGGFVSPVRAPIGLSGIPIREWHSLAGNLKSDWNGTAITAYGPQNIRGTLWTPISSEEADAYFQLTGEDVYGYGTDDTFTSMGGGMMDAGPAPSYVVQTSETYQIVSYDADAYKAAPTYDMDTAEGGFIDLDNPDGYEYYLPSDAKPTITEGEYEYSVEVQDPLGMEGQIGEFGVAEVNLPTGGMKYDWQTGEWDAPGLTLHEWANLFGLVQPVTLEITKLSGTDINLRRVYSLDTRLKDISNHPKDWVLMARYFTGCELDYEGVNSIFDGQHPGPFQHRLWMAEGQEAKDPDFDLVDAAHTYVAHGDDPEIPMGTWSMGAGSPGFKLLRNTARPALGETERTILKAFMELTVGEATGLTKERISKLYPNADAGIIDGVIFTTHKLGCYVDSGSRIGQEHQLGGDQRVVPAGDTGSNFLTSIVDRDIIKRAYTNYFAATDEARKFIPKKPSEFMTDFEYLPGEQLKQLERYGEDIFSKKSISVGKERLKTAMIEWDAHKPILSMGARPNPNMIRHDPDPDESSWSGPEEIIGIIPLFATLSLGFRDPESELNADEDSLLNALLGNDKAVNKELYQALSPGDNQGDFPKIGAFTRGQSPEASQIADFSNSYLHLTNFNPNRLRYKLPFTEVSFMSVDSARKNSEIMDVLNNPNWTNSEVLDITSRLKFSFSDEHLFYQNASIPYEHHTKTQNDLIRDSYYITKSKLTNGTLSLDKGLQSPVVFSEGKNGLGPEILPAVEGPVSETLIEPKFNFPGGRKLDSDVQNLLDSLYGGKCNAEEVLKGYKEVSGFSLPNIEHKPISINKDLLGNEAVKLWQTMDVNYRSKIFGRLLRKKFEDIHSPISGPDHGTGTSSDVLYNSIEYLMQTHGYAALQFAYSSQMFSKLKDSRLHIRKNMKKVFKKILKTGLHKSSVDPRCQAAFHEMGLTATRDMKEAKTDFFDLAVIKPKIIETYEKSICKDVFEGVAEGENSVMNALLEGCVLLLVKIYTLEMCLASVIAWDSFDIADIFQDELMAKIIIKNIRSDVENLDVIASIAQDILVKEEGLSVLQAFEVLNETSALEYLIRKEGEYLSDLIHGPDGVLINSRKISANLDLRMLKNSDSDFFETYRTMRRGDPSFNPTSLKPEYLSALYTAGGYEYVVDAKLVNNIYTMNCGNQRKINGFKINPAFLNNHSVLESDLYSHDIIPRSLPLMANPIASPEGKSATSALHLGETAWKGHQDKYFHSLPYNYYGKSDVDWETQLGEPELLQTAAMVSGSTFVPGPEIYKKSLYLDDIRVYPGEMRNMFESDEDPAAFGPRRQLPAEFDQFVGYQRTILFAEPNPDNPWDDLTAENAYPFQDAGNPERSLINQFPLDHDIRNLRFNAPLLHASSRENLNNYENLRPTHLNRVLGNVLMQVFVKVTEQDDLEKYMLTSETWSPNPEGPCEPPIAPVDPDPPLLPILREYRKGAGRTTVSGMWGSVIDDENKGDPGKPIVFLTDEEKKEEYYVDFIGMNPSYYRTLDQKHYNNIFRSHIYGYVPLEVWSHFYMNVFMKKVNNDEKLKKLYDKHGLTPFFKKIELGIRLTYELPDPGMLLKTWTSEMDEDLVLARNLRKFKTLRNLRTMISHETAATAQSVIIDDLQIPIAEVTKTLELRPDGFTMDGHLYSYSELGDSLPSAVTDNVLDATTYLNYGELGRFEKYSFPLLEDAKAKLRGEIRYLRMWYGEDKANQLIHDHPLQNPSPLTAMKDYYLALSEVAELEKAHMGGELVLKHPMEIINNYDKEMKQIINNTNQFFFKYAARDLLQDLKNTPEFRLMFDYLFPMRRYMTLAFLYAGDGFSKFIPEPTDILDETKNAVLQTLQGIINSGEYSYKPDPIAKMLEAFQIRSEAGTAGTEPDMTKQILMILTKTPMLILKGFVEMTDPSIITAKGILTAANAVQQSVVGALESSLMSAKAGAMSALRQAETALSTLEIQLGMLAGNISGQAVTVGLNPASDDDGFTMITDGPIEDWSLILNEGSIPESITSKQEFQSLKSGFEEIESGRGEYMTLVDTIGVEGDPGTGLYGTITSLNKEIAGPLADAKEKLQSTMNSPYALPAIWAALLPSQLPYFGGLMPPPLPGGPPGTIPGMIYLALLFIDAYEEKMHDELPGGDVNCADEL